MEVYETPHYLAQYAEESHRIEHQTAAWNKALSIRRAIRLCPIIFVGTPKRGRHARFCFVIIPRGVFIVLQLVLHVLAFFFLKSSR